MFIDILSDFGASTGFAVVDFGQVIMLVVSLILLFANPLVNLL